MTDEQRLAYEGFIDLMVQMFIKYSDRVDYSVLEKKQKENEALKTEKTNIKRKLI